MKTLRQALRSIGKAAPCAVPSNLETRWRSKSLKAILQRMYEGSKVSHEDGNHRSGQQVSFHIVVETSQ